MQNIFEDLKDKSGPLFFLRATFARLLTARTWKKRLQLRRKTSNWTALHRREQSLVSLGDCKDLQSGTELFYIIFDCKSVLGGWLVYTKLWEYNYWVHLLRYQIRLAPSSISCAHGCIGRYRKINDDRFGHTHTRNSRRYPCSFPTSQWWFQRIQCQVWSLTHSWL